MAEQQKHLVFDAANTLLHKPALWERWGETLAEFGYAVAEGELKQRHKLLSEHIFFPDRTDAAFYRHFNAEVLLALNIPPAERLLDSLFTACTYLPWEVFEDAHILGEVQLPMTVISNFHGGLRDLLAKLLPNVKFKHIIISEEVGAAKPSREFYNAAFAKIGEDPSRLHYVGDSLKLDVLPAREFGVHTYLIDRLELYPQNKDVVTVRSLTEFVERCSE